MAMLMSAACVLAGNIKDVWLAMPNSVAPYLNSKLRTQLVTFNQTGANPSVTNLVGGETRLDTLTESFMQVRMSDVSTLQLRLLPRAEGDSLVCVVKTVAGPQKRSQVAFYSLDWAPLSIQLPELPLPARPFWPNDTIRRYGETALRSQFPPKRLDRTILSSGAASWPSSDRPDKERG